MVVYSKQATVIRMKQISMEIFGQDKSNFVCILEFFLAHIVKMSLLVH